MQNLFEIEYFTNTMYERVVTPQVTTAIRWIHKTKIWSYTMKCDITGVVNPYPTMIYNFYRLYVTHAKVAWLGS